MKVKQLMMVTMAWASAGLPLTSAASAGSDAASLAPGHPAPADVIRRIGAEAPVRIGAAAVRALPDTEAGPRTLSAGNGSRSTLVVRATDNLVGVSANELVVIGADPAAVQRKVAELATNATTRVYADDSIVIVRLTRFADLLPLKQRLAQTFPAARFDLPVKYFDSAPN